MTVQDLFSLESTKSSILSLAKVHAHTAGLNKKRAAELERVPNIGDYFVFEKGHIGESDLAYLTAYTDCEFALLTGKQNDILFHGEKYSCHFDEHLSTLLREHKYQLYMHSHPGEDLPEASPSDRNVLLQIGQQSSKIISATTRRIVTFSNNSCLDYLLNQ